jgi:hypothetical protein
MEEQIEEAPKYKLYYAEHKDEILAKRKVRYETKKEELRAYQREYIRNKRAAAKAAKLSATNQDESDFV